MKKMIVLLLLVSHLYIQAYHQAGGTNYTEQGVHAYAVSRHGVDGALFLDPYFMPFLENVKDLTLLDAGCGVGPWSLYAAQHGAHVYGIDIQDGMIQRARQEAQEQGLDSITFEVGTVAHLPYADNFFDRAVSINVGCNLPQDIFVAHFKELYRVLKPGGAVVITAPANFATVFSTLEAERDAREKITSLLANIHDEKSLVEQIGALSSILRATIINRDNNFYLLSDEDALQEGDAIWRKIPGLVVPNYYHTQESYVCAAQDAGFTI
ncbi:MAG: class I SAM-dependent methyltransferase, partial [Candidatus Babeliales bacterium]